MCCSAPVVGEAARASRPPSYAGRHRRASPTSLATQARDVVMAVKELLEADRESAGVMLSQSDVEGVMLSQSDIAGVTLSQSNVEGRASYVIHLQSCTVGFMFR